jgi:hypothetical protein
MEIQYLKNVKSLMGKNGWRRENRGVDESEIEQLETQLGKRFPQAYREFLWLTGRRFSPWTESHTLGYLLEKKVNEYMPEVLKEYGVELPKDNYWVISIENGSINFFYFDEGENPPIYTCEFESKEYVEDYLRKSNNSLSEFMDEVIYYYTL